MVIKIDGKDCEKVLKDYAFATFGKIMGCETADELNIEIDCRYSAIEKIEITKKIVTSESEA